MAAAERIRELVKDPALRIGARAEALLYAAARAQLVEEALEPLLDAGTWVAARPVRRLLARLPGSGPRARRRRGARDQRVRDRRPDARPHAAADVDPQLGRARSRARAEPVDRLEPSATTFFARIAAAYDAARGRRPGADPDDRRDASRPTQVLAAALAGARGPTLSSRAGAPAQTPRRRRRSRSSPGLRGLPAELRADPLAAPRPASAGRPAAAAPHGSGSRRPVTAAAAAITSRTEKPLPLPRLKIRCSPGARPVERQQVRGSARSSMWM